MTSIINRGVLKHSNSNMKKSHFALVERYNELLNSAEDNPDECMTSLDQEVPLSSQEREYTTYATIENINGRSFQSTSSSLTPSSITFFPSNLAFSRLQNDEAETAVTEAPTTPLGNIPFSVYEESETDICADTTSAQPTPNQTSLNQSRVRMQNGAQVVNGCFTRNCSPPFSQTITPLMSGALIINQSTLSNAQPSQSTSPLSSSVSPSSISTASSLLHHATSLYLSSSSLPSLPSQSLQSVMSAATSPKHNFPSPCLTPPPQHKHSNNSFPNSLSSSQSSSLSLSAPSLPSLLTSSNLNNVTSNASTFQTKPPQETVSSFLFASDNYEENQNNEYNGLTLTQNNMSDFLLDNVKSENNNFNEMVPSNRTQEESIEYTDLDQLGGISFYDDLTSVSFKGDKPGQDGQSPIVSSTAPSGEDGLPLEVVVELMRSDLERDRNQLKLSHNPQYWTTNDVARWVKWVCQKTGVPDISTQLETYNGESLCTWTLDAFESLFGLSGSNVFQELELWKAANSYNTSSSSSDFLLSPSISPAPSNISSNSQDCSLFSSVLENSTDDVFYSDIEMTSDENTSSNQNSPAPDKDKTKPSDADIEFLASKNFLKTRIGRGHKKAITLWQFLLQLLIGKEDNSDCIRWLNRDSRIFKIEDSKKVANLWGRVKSRPAMNYDKLSRSVRQYYKKGIIKKPQQTKRLVYQFCEGIC